MNHSIIDRIRNDYIDVFLESLKKISYSDLTAQEGLVKVLYKDLAQSEIEGYPIASDFLSSSGKSYTLEEFNKLSVSEQATCELQYYYLPHSHELYVGTTGSGKTTGCVEPQLRAVSSQKNKPDLFLTDPKGELFNRNARHLREQGYEIFMLNFKELTRSDRWNPLISLYDNKIKHLEIGKNCIMRTGKIRPELELYAEPDCFSETAYIEYNGKAFPSGAECDNYIAFESDYLEANIDNEINQISNMLIRVQSKNDASWEYGAQDLLKGILHCMLEDAIDTKSGFTRDMMNLKTVQQYYLALKVPILDGRTTLSNHWLMKNKSDKPKALMATALGNASNTMRSYCGVFDGAVKDWFQGHIYALTTANSIILDNMGKPFAIFVITRDYEKSDFQVAGLFIDWVYRKMVERAEKTKMPRAMHFLLDEFGNIPEIKELENKIATSRSRNIWFHLVVQSYKQIDVVYGVDRSVIIRDNCNAQIFLGAQNRTTKEIFAAECGKHYIPTLESRLNTSNHSIREVPLIPVSDLDCITPGQMFIKRLYMPVIISQYIRSYICAKQGTYKHFLDADGLQSCTPHSVEPFSSSKYEFPILKRIFEEN